MNLGVTYQVALKENKMAIDKDALSELLDALRAGGDLDVVRAGMQLVLQALIDLEASEPICALRELRFSGTRIASVLGVPERTVRAVLTRSGLNRLPATDAGGPAVR